MTEDPQLRQLIERRERLEAVKADAAEDIKELNAEVKGMGYELPIFNAVIARRKKDRDEVDHFDAMLRTYETEAAVGGN